MAEIAAASSEQSSGIEQVNIAVTQMDEMTQQNAALVEEAAAAAESLQEQAGKLADAVSVFNLGQSSRAYNAGSGQRALGNRTGQRARAALASPATRSTKLAVAGGGNDEWEEF
jgi:hypothetical protein